MRPVTVSLSGSPATSPTIGLDTYSATQQVSVELAITGTLTVTVERTSGGSLWLADGADVTASGVVVLTKLPATGVRIRTTAGTGAVTATVLQSGMPGR
jgi:hypothetical protein